MESEELPNGWAVLALRDAVENQKGKVPKKFSNEPKNGFAPYIDIAAFETGEIKRYATTEKTTVSSEQDVLVVWDGARFGLAGEFSGGVLGSTLVRLNSRTVNQGYLLNFIKHHYRTINSRPRGTGTPHVEPDVFWSLQMGIPPLNEQHRIVEKIETLFARMDAGEAALRDVQKGLTRYRQSVLKAAVTGELTRDWRAEHADHLEHGRDLLARILETRRSDWQGRGKYTELTAPDTTDLPELPEGWTWATLPMLGEFGRGKSKHRPRNDPALYEDGNYPFLQTGRVRNSNGKISGHDALYNDLGLAQSKLWPRRTVCITIAANIAESGILELDACFPDSVVGLVPSAGVSAEYIECFIRTAKENLDRYAPATAQKNINLKILGDVAVPLPSEQEQVEIRNRLDRVFSAIAEAENTCQTELTRSKALRQSILKQAFAGRLVPQDPNDEPASAMLARIRAERESAKPARRHKATREPA